MPAMAQAYIFSRICYWAHFKSQDVQPWTAHAVQLILKQSPNPLVLLTGAIPTAGLKDSL